MNLNRMDPKLIILAVAVVLVIAVAVAPYMRKRRNTTAGLRPVGFWDTKSAIPVGIARHERQQ